MQEIDTGILLKKLRGLTHYKIVYFWAQINST